MKKPRFEEIAQEVDQINEALAKILCNNICVLIQEMHESGLKIDLLEAAHKVGFLHVNSMKISEEA
jgi:hypothetical protein